MDKGLRNRMLAYYDERASEYEEAYTLCEGPCSGAGVRMDESPRDVQQKSRATGASPERWNAAEPVNEIAAISG
jgi:hypothetical protein